MRAIHDRSIERGPSRESATENPLIFKIVEPDLKTDGGVTANGYEAETPTDCRKAIERAALRPTADQRYNHPCDP